MKRAADKAGRPFPFSVRAAYRTPPAASAAPDLAAACNHAHIPFRDADFEGDGPRRLAGFQQARDPYLGGLAAPPVGQRHPQPAERRAQPPHPFHADDPAERRAFRLRARNVRGHPAHGAAQLFRPVFANGISQFRIIHPKLAHHASFLFPYSASPFRRAPAPPEHAPSRAVPRTPQPPRPRPSATAPPRACPPGKAPHAQARHPARPQPPRFPRSIFPRRFARILAHQSVFRAFCSSRVSVLPGRARSASRRASSPRRNASQRRHISATVGKYGDSRRCAFTALSTMSRGNAARSSAQSSARIRNCAGVLPACG